MIKPSPLALKPIALKSLLLALCAAFACAPLSAQQRFTWQPSPGHTQVPIWPGAAPDAQTLAGPEFTESSGKTFLIAGQPVLSVERVSRPTMTVYSPKANNTGAAVIVFPGGGYYELAIDLEGSEVCDWLTPRGITCILLKYRVPGDPEYQTPGALPYPKSGPYPEAPQALEDAQRTLGLVRFHAAQWHIDPHKIGVLGFSAGGHLVAAISTHFDRIYPAVDAADAVSCRPDFAIAIYPGHLSLAAAEYDASLGVHPFPIAHPQPETSADRQYDLNPTIHVTTQTPPTFLLQNEDDHEDNVDDALSYYIALKTAGVPVEMHLYAHGGHAFGLRRTALPATAWPTLVDTWLATIHMVPTPTQALPAQP